MGLTNRVWVKKRYVWGSRLEGSLKTKEISWKGSRSGDISDEMTIFLEVDLVMSGLRSQLRSVTNCVWVWRRDVWGSILVHSMKTRAIHWTGSISVPRSAETKISWEEILEREISETGAAWDCIWRLKFLSWSTIWLYIVWFLSCNLLRCEHNSLNDVQNLSIISFRQDCAFSGKRFCKEVLGLTSYKIEILRMCCRGDGILSMKYAEEKKVAW